MLLLVICYFSFLLYKFSGEWLKKSEKYDNFILGDDMEKIKNFFKNRYVIIGIIVIAFVSLVVAIVMVIGEEENKFALNPIYDVYPQDVRELYANTVEVSCYGDLHFDIEIDTGEHSVNKLDRNYVIDYFLSHIDKNYGLNNGHTEAMLQENFDKLIAEEMDIIKYIDDYQYGDYVYSIENGKLVREKVYMMI